MPERSINERTRAACHGSGAEQPEQGGPRARKDYPPQYFTAYKGKITMGFLPDKPFNDLPPLPPKTEIETKAVLKKLVDASQFLAELKGYVELLPNKAIVINSIILQEAKDSSGIENIVTTHDQLFRAMVANTKIMEPAVKEVLNYRSALYKGFDLVAEEGNI